MPVEDDEMIALISNYSFYLTNSLNRAVYHIT